MTQDAQRTCCTIVNSPGSRTKSGMLMLPGRSAVIWEVAAILAKTGVTMFIGLPWAVLALSTFEPTKMRSRDLQMWSRFSTREKFSRAGGKKPVGCIVIMSKPLGILGTMPAFSRMVRSEVQSASANRLVTDGLSVQRKGSSNGTPTGVSDLPTNFPANVGAPWCTELKGIVGTGLNSTMKGLPSISKVSAEGATRLSTPMFAGEVAFARSAKRMPAWDLMSVASGEGTARVCLFVTTRLVS